MISFPENLLLVFICSIITHVKTEISHKNLNSKAIGDSFRSSASGFAIIFKIKPMSKINKNKGAPLWSSIQINLLKHGMLSKMSPKASKVYIALVIRSDFKSKKCYPSGSTLAKDTGLSLRSIRSSISELVKIGAIVKEKRYKINGDLDSNLYSIATIKSDKGSVIGALGVVQTLHQGSAKNDAGVVQTLHQGSAYYAPKQEPYNKNHITRTTTTTTRYAAAVEADKKRCIVNLYKSFLEHSVNEDIRIKRKSIPKKEVYSWLDNILMHIDHKIIDRCFRSCRWPYTLEKLGEYIMNNTETDDEILNKLIC